MFILKHTKFAFRKIHRLRIPFLRTSKFSKHLVKVPPMGDSINEGVILKINVKKGQKVLKD
jgi:hypothetical protein